LVAQAAKTKPADGKPKRDTVQVIAVNTKVYHDYLIRDTVEAGLVLTGTEIKSIRAGKVNLREAYAKAEGGELWLNNMHIAPYEAGDRWSPQNPTRKRKLLLHRNQIRELDRQTRSRGLTLVPVRLYISRDRAKIELALAQGKKIYDKRQAMAEKEAARDIERAVRARTR
jgi:SsrA-binding protein